MDNGLLINNTITAANIFELTKKALTKVGLEYICPLEDSIVDEQISKAMNERIGGMENDQ